MRSEGRGQGEGTDYVPWLQVQDFPSRGRVNRLVGWTTNRVHHLLSDMETRYFYLLDWDDNVVDIREHYPLHDLEETVKDGDLHLERFRDPAGGVTRVLTTTFLVTTIERDQKQYVARSLRVASELEKRSVLEKLEIERRYWSIKGVDWRIVTQRDIPDAKARNIEWLHSSRDLTACGIRTEDAEALMGDFVSYLSGSRSTVRDATMRFDQDNDLDTGTGLYLFKHLLSVKRIGVDMDKPIDLNMSSEVEIIDREWGKDASTKCADRVAVG